MHAPNPSLQRERCGNFIICVIMCNEYIKSNLQSEFDVFLMAVRLLELELE